MSLLRPGVLVFLALAAPLQAASAVQLFIPDPNNPTGDPIALEDGPAEPANTLPVLFVHGHNTADANDADFNYRKNWIDPFNGLPSFQAALNLLENAQLGIEPYYIRFELQGRSIADDAAEIAEAVEIIRQRHDSEYDAADPNSTSPVQVVIIAYSKGTISTRLYLKNHHAQQQAVPAGQPVRKPVSEFIAIAPPNHGIYPLGGLLSLFGETSLAAKQLYNGYEAPLTGVFTGNRVCSSYDEPLATDFIRNLNGHPMEDTHADAFPLGTHPSEAPGSRALADKRDEGVLYVTIYADANRDFVGGDDPPGSPNNQEITETDCEFIQEGLSQNPPKQGRVVARNLAPDAVNISTASVTGADSVEVHQNTVHSPDVICLALYTAVHHRTPAASTGVCSVLNGIPIIPPPPRAAAELVLDLSGSMRSPPCPGCASKIDILKDAVELFIDLWKIVGAPTDQLGVTYFASAVNELACNETAMPRCRTLAVNQVTPDEEALLALLQEADEIKTNVVSQDASGLTAMGGGLDNGIERLLGSQASSERRRVILFTDGMQNVPPMVHAVAPDCLEADCEYEIATTPPRPLIPGLGTPVDTIGIGAGDAFLELLEAISDRTGGRSNTTLDPDNDLRRFFIEELISALRGFSPQLVAYRRGRLQDDEAVERFEVNRGARKVIFKVSWRRAERLTFRVEKAGIDVTQAGQLTSHGTYHIFAMPVPMTFNGRAVEGEGEWSVRIRGRPGVEYHAAAIVDEPRLTYEASLGTDDYVVGERLSMTANLSIAGSAPDPAAQVSATVSVPGNSVGNLLATTPAPREPPGFQTEPNASRGQRKLQLMLLDEGFLERLKASTYPVNLQHVGAGEYQAQSDVLDVPGLYQVVFTIEGEHPEIGRYRRTESRTTHVGIAAPDLAMSAVRVEAADSASGERLLRIRPRDRFGNYLGPDYAHRLHFSLSAGKVNGPIEDHGDGTYTLSLSLPEQQDPDVRILVLGQQLFEGPFSALQRLSEGEASVWKRALMVLILLFALLTVWLIRKRHSSVP